MDGPPKWYQNPLFDRYWHHYRETLGWFQRHKQVLYELEHGVEKSCEWPFSPGIINACSQVLRSDYSDDQRGPEEELEMEVTEEMIAFFAQSERHRRELSESALSGGDCQNQVVGCGIMDHHKSLYGKSAAMIHGMETAMQLSCDRFRDTKQPKHWPNIPLKL
ncbi:unnamed protein product [Ixodes persulcatus]